MATGKTGLTFLVLGVLSACAVMPLELEKTEDDVFTRPAPDFPRSEQVSGREGWVLVGYSVARSGLVSDLNIKDSSGKGTFEQAAIDAVRQWRYPPGEERELTVLVNFVYDRTSVQLSRRFMRMNDIVHEYIDGGDLDAAEIELARIRSNDDLTAFELAYSFMTEGRIFGTRGDKQGQLDLFRKAILNDGRWLARRNYLSCLHAVIVLEMGQGDYASALRDYELLTRTSVGRKLATDLEGPIQNIRASFGSVAVGAQPYLIADSSVSVVRERIRISTSEIRPPQGGVSSAPPSKPSK